jgi:hypothetical protein
MDRPDSPPPADTPGDEQPMARSGAVAAAPKPEFKRRNAEMQFLLIAMVLLMMIALAGVPGGMEKEAGDGSEALELSWAQRHAAAHPDLEPTLPVDDEPVAPVR